MAFLSHLEYTNYTSSPEIDSPYTPDFPSPPIIDSVIHAAPPPTDTYQVDHPYRSWATLTQPCDDFSFESGFVHALEAQKQSFFFPQFSGEFHLHAPTPLPGQSSLLFSDTQAFESPAISDSYSYQFQYPIPDSGPHLSPLEKPVPPVCHSVRPLLATFPTPSEMLGEIAANALPFWDSTQADCKPDNARKPRRRAMTKTLDFVPTESCAANPALPHLSEPSLILSPSDSISSHEKKRHYLECLEQYVMFLHQQLQLVGVQPLNLERSASNTRGMSSKSIRTLLVHMQHTNRQLNLQTITEEQRFLSLRDTVSRRE